MMKPKRKLNRNLKRVLLVLAIAAAAALLLDRHLHPVRYVNPEGNALVAAVPFLSANEVDEKTVEIPRGTKVQLRQTNGETSEIAWNGQRLWVPTESLANSLQECISEDSVYVRTTTNLSREKDGELDDTVARKGETLKVISASAEDLDPETGMVAWYEVSKGGRSWWIPGQYVETQKEEADSWNGDGVYYSRYWDAYYGDGYSKEAFIDSVDWKQRDIPEFEDNEMPKEVKGFHVSLANLMEDPDWYLETLEGTEINTIVVELKDEGGIVAYNSPVCADYLSNPSAAVDASVQPEDVAEVIKKFDEAGFYTVARISVFKDGIYAEQNPDQALQEMDGSLLYMAGSHWASPYSRDAWMYNTDLAVEASDWFDEIQLDYTRFPEGLAQLDGNYIDHNEAGQSKAAVIQAFVSHVADKVHENDTYLSVDIFALTVSANDDQDLGQFAPALLMVADAVSPMPYADHFAAGSMGLEEPWEVPGETVFLYTQNASNVFKNKVQYRPWIQAYTITPEQVEEEIDAIHKNGYQNWLLWDVNGSKPDLEAVLDAVKVKDTEKEEK